MGTHTDTDTDTGALYRLALAASHPRATAGRAWVRAHAVDLSLGEDLLSALARRATPSMHLRSPARS